MSNPLKQFQYFRNLRKLSISSICRGVPPWLGSISLLQAVGWVEERNLNPTYITQDRLWRMAHRALVGV